MSQDSPDKSRRVSIEAAACGRLDAVLADVPGLAAAIGDLSAISRQDGLSNEVFRIDGSRGEFVLRLERASLRGRVDRRAEAAFARRAADLGLGPSVVLADPERGVMLLQALPEARPLASGDRADPGEAVLLGVALRKLHQAEGLVASPLHPEELIAGLRARVPAARLSALQTQVVEAAMAAARELGADPVHPVPSHCDPVPQNVLLSGGRLWLIDFEYAALADPAWDLAYAGLEAGYGAAARMALLTGYCAGDFPAAAKLALRVGEMRPVCDVVSALWALDQAEAGNPATDFTAYAEARLARARTALDRSGA
ncbi:phosphotransferase [Pannonibacter carbonis]|uniref:phosphotransferase n=1 Tax=Pannonibacter carbonis TaxID=2067569 RepID=UPI000D0F249D|nr:phosphotransferase [Pannonibacter carbonis]